MFEQLIKFSSINFEEGQLGFQAGSTLYLVGFLIVALLIGFIIVYSITNLFTSNRSKALSLGIRIPALLLLCLPLMEPVLIMPDVVPDENFVAVLIDASESMNVPDGKFGETRRDDVNHLLNEEQKGFIRELREHFKVRLYTFNKEASRSDSLQFALFEGRETNISSALDRVLSDFKGVPLSGVVLLTDGGDNSTEVPLNRAEQLRGLDIPLHVVGIGSTTFEQEREILDVTVTRSVEETTGAEIDVKVRSWMSEEQPVDFNIYRGEELVFTEKRTLKGEGKIDQLTFFYEPDQTSASEYEISVLPAPQERNTANNSLKALIDTRRDTIRVLYIEGHPRRDFKYIKRVLEDDQVIEFTSVLRTGTGKFYRQGIKQPDELAGGFPASEAELYRYKAIVLGDVEASAFTLEQLQMIERAVRIRGSGFLMLGGQNTYVDGDYWNTPVADLLPVDLDRSRRSSSLPDFADPDLPPEEQGFRFAPTPAGYENPILKLSSDMSINRMRWTEMPGLTSMNLLGAVKPGAVVLAEKEEDDFGDREPLLVIQRYGKGRTAALATASTWRWQMLMDEEDKRHERFWRQLVRWLTGSAPNRANIEMETGPFAPGEEMSIALNTYNPEYLPQDNATILGSLTDPFGVKHEIQFQADLSKPGTSTATFVPQDEGMYDLEITAEVDGQEIGLDTQSFLVRPSHKEYYDATLKRTFLTSLATASGGFYYNPDDAGQIADNLRGRRTSTSIFTAEYLWDIPLIFGMILGLLSIEWIYRRRKGLP